LAQDIKDLEKVL